MTRTDHLADSSEQSAYSIQHELPLDRVTLHHLELAVCQSGRLVQDFLGDRDLPNIVQQRGELQLLTPILLKPHIVGHGMDKIDD